MEACNPGSDLYCDKCGATEIQLMCADTSAGEYGCVMICRPCIDSLFDALPASKNEG